MRLVVPILLAATLAQWPGPGGPFANAQESKVAPKVSEWTDARLEQTDPEKLFDIGKSYALGKDVPKNPDLAARMFKSAHRRKAWPAGHIGWFYRYKAKDGDRAIHWYKIAIAEGDKSSHSSLGSLYYYRRLVSRNYIVARDHLLKASGGGASALLGHMYLKGLGTTPDPETAKNGSWMRRGKATDGPCRKSAKHISR